MPSNEWIAATRVSELKSKACNSTWQYNPTPATSCIDTHMSNNSNIINRQV